MKAKLMHPMSLENYAALEESLIEVVTSLGFQKTQKFCLEIEVGFLGGGFKYSLFSPSHFEDHIFQTG